MKKLSKFQKRLYDRFNVIDTDIAIPMLYMSLYEMSPPCGIPSSRTMQQRLAPTIMRINAKLEATQIVPGNLKQTYRIVRK